MDALLSVSSVLAGVVVGALLTYSLQRRIIRESQFVVSRLEACRLCIEQLSTLSRIVGREYSRLRKGLIPDDDDDNDRTHFREQYRDCKEALDDSLTWLSLFVPVTVFEEIQKYCKANYVEMALEGHYDESYEKEVADIRQAIDALRQFVESMETGRRL